MANDISGPDSDTIKVWIEADKDAPAGCGRIMVSVATDGGEQQSIVASAIPFLSRILGVLSPSSPKVASNIAVSSKFAANDNVYWLGDDDRDGENGIFASDVDAATLANGETVVAWIGDDRHVHARLIDRDGAFSEVTGDTRIELNKLLADLGDAGQGGGPSQGRVKVSPLGSNGFSAFWLADFGLTAALMGKAFLSGITSAEAHEDNAGASGWSVKDIAPMALSPGAKSLAVRAQADGTLKVSVSEHGPGDDASAVNEFTVSLGASDDDGDAPVVLVAETPPEPAQGDAENELPLTDVRHGSGSPVLASHDGGAESSDAGTGAAGSDTSGADLSAGEGTQGQAIDLPDGIAPTLAGKLPPVVVVTPSGTSVLVQFKPGAEPGTTAIEFTKLGADGQPVLDADGAPQVTVVTENAITEDAEHPNLDLAPSVAATDDQVSFAWLEAVPRTETGGEAPVLAIKLQGYDSEGEAIADEPVTVVTTSDTVHSISDFQITYLHAPVAHASPPPQAVSEDANEAGAVAPEADAAPAPDGGDEAAGDDADQSGVTAEAANESDPPAASDTGTATSDEAPASEPAAAEEAPVSIQIAVVWVQNADDNGYGDIMGQRFGLVDDDNGHDNSGKGSGDDDDRGQSFVALGCDGSQGGDNDSAFSIGDDGSSSAGAVGRAPSVAGAGDNAIVVTWVQETSAGSGVEVVDGVVLNTDGGQVALHLDLSDLMPNGILKGTDPIVATDDRGDIVVSWLQTALSGGYDAAAAIYEYLSSGTWSVPGNVLLLSHFDDLPDALHVSITGGSDPEIVVAWQDDGRTITGEHFDLDGVATGEQFSYRADHHDDNSGSGSSSDDDFTAALLPDGQILVVYPSSETSDTGITALVVSVDVPAVDAPSADSASLDDSGAGGAESSSSSSDLPVAETSGPVPVAVADEDSDQIVINFSSGSSNSGSGSSGSSGSSSGESGSSGSGSGGSSGSSGGSGDDGSGDLYSSFASDGKSGSGGDDDDDRGSSSSGKGGGSGHDDASDNLIFVSGFGNDIADYVDEDHFFDDIATTGDPIADAFDALQFANALSDAGNLEVITFDASNVVVIRDFETL